MTAGSDSEAGASDPGIRLLTRIADFVAPLTRFDRGHILLQSSQHISVDVVARQVFRVGFDIARSEGNGGLPAGVIEVPSAEALTRDSEGQKSTARAAVPGRLAAWAEAYGEDPRARPEVGDCFTIPPPLGHVEMCVTCGGDGKIECALCKAAGTLTCEACSGQGSKPCEACSAIGEVTCVACKGMGTTVSEKQQKVWDDAIGAHRVEHVQELAKCSSCGGAGKTKCATCNGKTTIVCAVCEGRKTIQCTRCGGAGSEKCEACGGEGKRHRMTQLSCFIRETFETSARGADVGASVVLGSLPNIEQVLDFAESHRATAEISADTLRRDTLATTPVTTIVVQAAGKQTVIRGFGPRQAVMDYGNIAGMLMAEDLATLEAVLPATRLVPPRVNEALHAALSNMLASEVNANLATQAMKKDLGGMERDLRGLVDPEYLKRAARAMTKAMQRAYWAMIYTGPGWVLAGSFLIAPFDLVARSGGQGARLTTLLTVMALTFGAAVGAHYWGVRKLQQRIRPDGVPKLGPIIDRLNLTRNWLIVAAASTAILTLATASLFSWLFPVGPPPAPAVPVTPP